MAKKKTTRGKKAGGKPKVRKVNSTGQLSQARPPKTSDKDFPHLLPLDSAGVASKDRPLLLTTEECEALIRTTSLGHALRTKLEGFLASRSTVAFDSEELIEMHDSLIQELDQIRVRQLEPIVDVLDKLSRLLSGAEKQGRNARREGKKATARSGGLTEKVYQIKMTLKGVKPPIWRRVEMRDGSLGELHEVIQIVMGWENSHLHQFVIDGEYYGETTGEGFGYEPEMEDEFELALSDLVGNGKKQVKFTYEYDFGDSWEHEIVIEKTLDADPKVQYPRCTAGARACPPEDVGGVWGYVDLLEAMADPTSARYEELIDWLPEDYDPEQFDADVANQEMSKYLEST